MTVTLTSKSKRSDGRKREEDLIATSLKRFKITAEAESEWRSKGMEDLKFSIGTGQWDEAVKSNREIEGKPCLTINRAPAFLRQYTGEERQHRPAMLVSPNGSGADLEVAKIHQGVLRHFEVVSEADFIYDYSYDMGMRVGSHPWRIKTEYLTERSFDQEPRIEAIENGFNYFGSPIRRPDGTDPLWAHVICDYSKEEYVAEFGKTELARLKFPTTAGANEPGWVTKDGARVAEYWWIELTPKTLCLMDDGRVLLREEVPKKDRAAIAAERETILRRVHCVKHDAMEVLKRYEWVGKYIPFPEFNAQRLNVNGKIYRAGMIRDYRDAQRIYDFMVTRAVEQVDMCSKDPLWVPEENAQWENDYRQMNRKNFSHLYYKAYDKQNRQLPIPQRAGREAPIQAMRELIQQADYDMKAVIGIYGPGLGEEAGNEQESGFAIMTRQQQSDTGMMTYHDNLNRAIKWQGRILLDLWPKLIDSARVQRIINPDDSVKHQVIFNSQHTPIGEDGQIPDEVMQLLNAEQGLKKAYDVGAGDYDIVLSTGPMYRTARQEAFKALTVVIGENPQMLMPILGDVWAKNADFPDAHVIEQRLKKLLPPNLQDQGDQDLQSQLTQAQAALQAMSDQHNQLVAELNRASDTIRTKRLDVESRERIALLTSWTQLTVQRLKEHDTAAQKLMDMQLHAMQMRFMQLHGLQPVEAEAGPAPETPELPTQVEPHVQPIVPASPTPRPQPIA
jgi:hypothetical protein